MELNNDHRLGRINAMHGTLSKIIDASDAKDLWKPLPIPSKSDGIRATAVDGGGVRELELRDGSAIIIARAIAVNNAGEQPIRDVIVNWVPVFAPTIKWVLLSYIESEVALRAIEGGRYDFLLLDGSLYAKITALIHELILTKGFLDLYYVPRS